MKKNMDYIDQLRYANKELGKTRKELEYQKVYAQAAMELYDEQTIVLHAIMTIKGALADMWTQLLLFEKHTGKKATDSRERLEAIQKNIDIIAKVQADNYALKWNAGEMRKQIWDLMNKNKDLTRQLELHLENIPLNITI